MQSAKNSSAKTHQTQTHSLNIQTDNCIKHTHSGAMLYISASAVHLGCWWWWSYLCKLIKTYTLSSRSGGEEVRRSRSYLLVAKRAARCPPRSSFLYMLSAVYCLLLLLFWFLPLKGFFSPLLDQCFFMWHLLGFLYIPLRSWPFFKCLEITVVVIWVYLNKAALNSYVSKNFLVHNDLWPK